MEIASGHARRRALDLGDRPAGGGRRGLAGRAACVVYLGRVQPGGDRRTRFAGVQRAGVGVRSSGQPRCRTSSLRVARAGHGSRHVRPSRAGAGRRGTQGQRLILRARGPTRRLVGRGAARPRGARNCRGRNRRRDRRRARLGTASASVSFGRRSKPAIRVRRVTRVGQGILRAWPRARVANGRVLGDLAMRTTLSLPRHRPAPLPRARLGRGVRPRCVKPAAACC